MFLYDRINLDSQRRYSDEGFLEVPAFIARSGIQEYRAFELGLTDRDPASVVRVFRPPEEVFAEDSLNSFSNKPVTNNHPPGLIDSNNAIKFSVGHAGLQVAKVDDKVQTTLHVISKEAIDEIEAGKTELSNGYTADVTFSPGLTPDGESYDAVQSNIRGNHIAIVDRARGGSGLRVFDDHPHSQETKMPKLITIDGVDYEVSEQAAQAIGKVQQKVADAETTAKAQAKVHQQALDAKQAENDALQAKLDEAKTKVMTAEQLDTRIEERSQLIDDARKVDPDVEWKGKTEAEIRRAVVDAKAANVTSDSEEYIKARFDMLVSAVAENPGASLDAAMADQVKDTSGKKKEMEEGSASKKARDEFAKKSRDAWKGAAA